MQNMNKSCALYTEQEIAELLGVTLSRLYDVLDRHIFNDGTLRPANLTFTNSELVLLRYWLRSEPNPKVVCMPRRN